MERLLRHFSTSDGNQRDGAVLQGCSGTTAAARVPKVDDEDAFDPTFIDVAGAAYAFEEPFVCVWFDGKPSTYNDFNGCLVHVFE